MGEDFEHEEDSLSQWMRRQEEEEWARGVIQRDRREAEEYNIWVAEWEWLTERRQLAQERWEWEERFRERLRRRMVFGCWARGTISLADLQSLLLVLRFQRWALLAVLLLYTQPRRARNKTIKKKTVFVSVY